MKHTITAALLAAIAVAAPPMAALSSAATVGAITQKEYYGALGFTPGASEPEELVYDQPVQENEKLRTSDGGTVLRFVDESRLAVDAHSDVVLDHFVYNPQSSSVDGGIGIAKGILRLTSGGLPMSGTSASPHRWPFSLFAARI